MIVAEGPITPDAYLGIRAMLFDAGYHAEWEWAQTVVEPETPEALACEYAWVVINSGMRNTVARKIMDRVWPVVTAGGSAHAAFGHRGKAQAIDDGWRRRVARLEEFRAAGAEPADRVAWCGTLPWIGDITKWHLAKNLGVDCAKPDRWLVRLAAVAGETVDGLCRRLAAATGDRVATVDLVLWRACALGLLVPRT